jgi:hypothetical protein
MNGVMVRQLIIPLAGLVLAIPTLASPIAFTLDPSVLSTLPGGVYQPADCYNLDGSGSCLLFTGTISLSPDDDSDYYYLTGMQLTMDPGNPDGGADVFDNNLESGFFANVPGTLGGGTGDSYTGTVFEVDVEPGAPAGAYFGTAELIGGTDPSDTDPTNPSDILATADFEVDVLATPEPGMGMLMFAGLGAMAAAGRRLRRRWVML